MEREVSARPVFRTFAKANETRLLPDSKKRQGLITHLAFQHLGGRDSAIRFLNAHNDVLGARPLDLATGSHDGYLAVAQLIATLEQSETRATA